MNPPRAGLRRGASRRGSADGPGWLLAAWLLAAPAAAGETVAEPALGARLAAHITFLADDLLKGRQPGTAGYDIAAAYVASQFQQLGLVPAGEGGGYFQQVPLRRAYLEPGSASLALETDDGTVPFTFVEQFYTGPSVAQAEADLSAPLAFAGYGIHAPELGYSDYDGLDVAGRVVVALAGMPASFPSEEGAHFASSREKYRSAIDRGAVGLIRIHTPRRERRSDWGRVRDRVGAPAMAWLTTAGEPWAGFPQLQANLVMHHEAAVRLFEGAAFSMQQLLDRDESGAEMPRFALAGRIHARQRSRHDRLTSPNVVAMLPGSDPLLSAEYVVYTAHLDHIGELHGDGHGDRINNGALDNASGVSVMLETARLLATGAAPRRSLLFVAVTAEEKGLVGSEYFAINPTVPVTSLVAAINLDMPLLLYDFGDVVAFGAEHSSLGGTVREAAGEFGVALAPDPMPEENIFVRSDHYRFVQQGVPAVFLVTGPRARDGTTDTGATIQRFLQAHYHRPSDDLDLPIDYAAAARFTRINARIGEMLANDPQRPYWLEGDFFGTTFGR